MCEYCDRKSLEADSLVPIIDSDFNLLGDTIMEICTALGIDDNGEIEEEVYLSNFCIATQKINYCPICGKSLRPKKIKRI